MVEFPVMPGESSERTRHPHRPQAADREPTRSARRPARRGHRPGGPAGPAGEAHGGAAAGGGLAGARAGAQGILPCCHRGKLFADRLTSLKDEAAKQQAETKTAVLTKNIQARFNELQALIDRYLDDEAFAAYTEALERKDGRRRPRPAKAKTKHATAAGASANPPPATGIRRRPRRSVGNRRHRQTGMRRSRARFRSDSSSRTLPASGSIDDARLGRLGSVSARHCGACRG